MSNLSDEPLGLDTLNFSTAKVSDFILVLRSAFQTKEFDEVEQILTGRENRLTEDLCELNKRYELIEKKHGIAAIDKIKAENETARCRRQLDELKDRVALLQDDNRMLEEKASVFEERERKARAKVEKLVEEIERVERKSMEMVVKVNESDSKRAEAERELERIKKKNEEMELRVCKLEEVVDKSDRHHWIEEDEGSTDVVANGTRNETINANSNGAEVKEVILNGHEKVSDSVEANNNPLKKEGTGFGIHPCNEVQTVLERGDSSHRDKRQKRDTADVKTEPGVVIDISDSDVETPTQDQTPNVPTVALPDGGNQCTSSSQMQRGSYLGIGKRVNDRKDNGFTLSSSSSESCDSDTIFELIKQRRGSS